MDAHATDAGVSVCPRWRQRLCERAWATDAVARLTCVRRTRLSARSVNTLSGPRLSQATDAGSRASDASDAVGANAMNFNGRTRGGHRSDGRYCAASVDSVTDATVQRMSPPNFAQ
jgi:hypothetical protein